MTSRGPVHAVVTNDDGIDSEGLRTLAGAALESGWDVTIAAPDRQASGSGTAMTAVRADSRVVVERRTLPGLESVPAYAVQAAPGFIAFTAVRGAFGREPDVLLSGINIGPNTGRVVLHSGTVGAAMTAAIYGTPAAAFSLGVTEGTAAGDGADASLWRRAADVVRAVLPELSGVPAGAVLNVNIPGGPRDQVRGIRQGRLAIPGAVQLSLREGSGASLHVAMAETGQTPEPGTDEALLAAGYAAVTTIRPVCELPPSPLPWPAG